MRINVANYNKFIDALESGEFKQGKGRLEYNGAFCCLGVACKIFEIVRKSDDVYGPEVLFGVSPQSGVAPDELKQGTLTIEGKLTSDFSFIWTERAANMANAQRDNQKLLDLKLVPGRRYNLILLNDGMGASFKAIAGVLRCRPHFINADEEGGQF